MVLIILHVLNGQNNKGLSLFDKGSMNREKMGAKCLIKKEFPNNTTTSLEYFFIKHYSYVLWMLMDH